MRHSSARSRRHARTQPRTMSTPQEILELTVGEPAHGGACVARDSSSRVIFVRHAVPGETVRAQVTSTRQKLAWADAIDVLQPSEDRVPSVWAQAGPFGVGGGELAHVRPSAQRRWKEAVIANQLRRIGGVDLAQRVDDLGGVHVHPAPSDTRTEDPLLHRRSRIELVINEECRAGMHRFRSRDIIPLDSMPLAHQAIQGLELFTNGSRWSELWKPGQRIRVVAPNNGQPVVVTPEGIFDPSGQELHREHLEWSVVLESGEHLHYRVRAQGFWQAHIDGASVLANAVVDMSDVHEGDTVLELYSGAGLLTKAIATRIGKNGQLLSLEGDENAVRDAGENVRDLPRVEAFAGVVDDEGVRDLSAQCERAPSAVVMDPPRSGAGREVCRAVAALKVPRIVLISCDPAAGARDMKALTEQGYRLDAFQAWDLFPHTHHVECVSLLVKA